MDEQKKLELLVRLDKQNNPRKYIKPVLKH